MSDSLLLPVTAAVCLALGFAAAYVLLRARSGADRSVLEERLRARDQQLVEASRRAEAAAGEAGNLRRQVAELERTQARLEAEMEGERRSAAEKLALMAQAETRFKEAFQALSATALRSNNESFLELARTQLAGFQQQSQADLEERRKAIDALVKPIQESLAKVDGKLEQVEQTRAEAQGSLTQFLHLMQETQARLQSETANLVKALRAPNVRGQWGEIQLKRVVEMAGMVQYCDFVVQETLDSEDGRRRPDMVVRLPNRRCVAVDAKATLSHYLDAIHAADEGAKLGLLKQHAAQVRLRVGELSDRRYTESIPSTPEFVVLFLPGEPLFSAALEQDPSLIEFGVDKKVLIATPTTLIALLKAVAHGWRQEEVAENARAISALGKDLYDRIRTLAKHFAGVAGGLNRAVEAYNSAVGSLESRVLPAARRFRDLRATEGEEIPVLEGIEPSARRIVAPELLVGD